MNAETTLGKIMTYLGMENEPGEAIENPTVEVKFEQRKQAEGDVVFEADSFEPGDAVFVLTEDGERIPAPEGHYAMEDGNVMMVNDQGIIDAYDEQPSEEEEEAPVQEEPQGEVEAGYDDEEMAMDGPKKDMAQPKRVIETESKSVEMQFEKQISEIEIKFKAEKEEWSKQLAEVEAQRVALSAEVDELKSKLAQEPASKPLKHSVESTVQRKEFFKAKGNVNTTESRVYNRLFNK